MKNPVININPDNGHIDFLNLDLSPEFKQSDLPDSFAKMPFQSNERQGISANIKLTEKNILYEVWLGFEAGLLTGIRLDVTPPEHNYSTSDDFYNGIGDRYDYHHSWLKKQLPSHSFKWGWVYELLWGIAHVVRDKSENVYIIVDYKENNFKMSKRMAVCNKLRGCPE